MNDPGLDKPIDDADNEAYNTVANAEHSNDKDGQPSVTSPEDNSSTMPTRWWYASTAFPLIAGTFGPMANAFSVNALVQNWRVEVPPGGTEEHGIDIKDPHWLIAVNAVSLVLALIANLFLLLNMAKRVRFEIAQPVTIVGFWSASVLLIGLISTASTSTFHAQGVQDQALTQAFYYGIYAAGLYQIISYLMCITVWGAYKGAYSKDFELTIAQRTLMLQTISFLVYLEVGALIYCHIEGWKFLDALYFMDFTLLTVGIGDYAPMTHLGRGLLFPIAIGGIIAVGLVISSIRSMILDRGAEKISARLVEKTRRRVVKQVDSAENHVKMSRSTPFKLNLDKAKDLAQEPTDDRLGELKRRKLEFEAMRSVQDMAGKERKYTALLLSTTAFAIMWFVGAVVFWRAERNQQWTYFQSLYFAYTSILSIGYGDFSPMSNSGKSFFVFWSLLAVPTLTILISNMGDTVVKGVKDITIYLGEISFLPSTDTSTRDRLRLGLYKATLGKLKFDNSHMDGIEKGLKEEEEEEWANFREAHPGLVQIFDEPGHRNFNRRELHVLDRMASAWSEQEFEDEKTAQEHHDKRAEAEHHYRHLLISQIGKVYGDTKLKEPKKYSYAEWTFYLKLLGEDETNRNSHRRELPKQTTHAHHDKKRKQTKKENESSSNGTSASTESNNETSAPPKWSWIGKNSPLMQGQDEAEWILERMFEKLEESIRSQTPAKHATDLMYNTRNDISSGGNDTPG